MLGYLLRLLKALPTAHWLHNTVVAAKKGEEGGREGEKEGGMEVGREGDRAGGRECGREGERE